MTYLYERTTPLDHAACSDFQESLSNVQGNILRGHGKDRAIHVFFTFQKKQQPQVKTWIAKLAQYITSAQGQSGKAKPPDLFVSFFLSASGYDYLDPNFAQKKTLFGSEAFRYGMRAAQLRLNDPLWQEWEATYQREIHAMLLLAGHDEGFLREKTDELCQGIMTYTDVLSVEWGKVMWMPDEAEATKKRAYRVEHFGYADGFSQPLLFQDDVAQLVSQDPSQGDWNPGAGPALVLVQDPYGKPGDCGSYLVFRKLEQRVRDFKMQEQALADVLGSRAAQAEALIMGRFRNGTPVVLSSTAVWPVPKPYSFDYQADPDGQKCPVQAHIRAVNPRRPGIPRIVRRGMPYGDRAKEPKDRPCLQELPTHDVGLLFMCYQSNIEKQFEVLQALLANDPRFPRPQEPGIDPVIGQPGSLGTGKQLWPRDSQEPRTEHVPYTFANCVRLKGGEYFFAPSLHFLKHIQTILAEK